MAPGILRAGTDAGMQAGEPRVLPAKPMPWDSLEYGGSTEQSCQDCCMHAYPPSGAPVCPYASPPPPPPLT